MAKWTQKLVFFPWKWLLEALLVLAALGALVALVFLFLGGAYQGKVFPGVYFVGRSLSGRNAEQVDYFVKERLKEINAGVEFYYGEKKVVLLPEVASFDAGLVYKLFEADAAQTTRQIMAVGRRGDWWQKNYERLFCLLKGCGLPLAINYNQEKIKETLRQEFADFETPVREANLIFSADGGWQISQEAVGQQFDYDGAVSQLVDDLNQVQIRPIELKLERQQPKIFRALVGDVSGQVNKFLAAAPLVFKYEERSWTVSERELKNWLTLKIDQANGRIVVGFNEEAVKKYWRDKIAPAVNEAPTQSKFTMQDGRVEIFQAAQNGREIDEASTVAALASAVESGQKEVGVAVKILPAISAASDAAALGIVEIIGTGTSSFAGSPPNRRHNIRVGAKALNGLIVKAGEEFSLLKALGKVDAKAGYLQELVIKENRTIPEYGGGLCQIGTTTFRTVIASGLPVTMRRNHSYRVVYYEPAGTDATIYDPWPDFKFINDTGNNILIQTRLEGNILTFDFWGKRDGRLVEKTKPVIYNIVKPAPSKIVETLDLKPGVKKCTERAHNGASAYFDYKVIYPNGEVKAERFSSHYVPWQEVCLIGVEKLTEPGGEQPTAAGSGMATSTVQ